MNNVRASDPITSVMAAERSALFSGKQANRILACLFNEPELTASEISQSTGLTVEQICRRLPELQSQKQVRVVQEAGKDKIRDGYRVWTFV